MTPRGGIIVSPPKDKGNGNFIYATVVEYLGRGSIVKVDFGLISSI